jgi:hypothetical protein
LLLLRLATVALDALLFQLPPRMTRFVPEAAPIVFRQVKIPIKSAQKYPLGDG